MFFSRSEGSSGSSLALLGPGILMALFVAWPAKAVAFPKAVVVHVWIHQHTEIAEDEKVLGDQSYNK